MNRTHAYFALAFGLALVALAVNLPRPTGAQPPSPASPPARPNASKGVLNLTGKLSHPSLLQGTSDVFASLEVSAPQSQNEARAPVNFALVIDNSGSMAGSKLQNAKLAAQRLVGLLGERDRLAIIHYSNDATSFTSSFCTAQNQERMRTFIANITHEGGTNIGAGLVAGQQQLNLARSDFRVNRLLLLSDGQPTVGLVNPEQLASLVARIRSGGSSVTSLGVGADFNEDLMQRLADVGGGAYGFISDETATAGLFEADLKQATTVVAQQAVVRLTLPEGVELGEVFGRVTSVSGRTVTLQLPDIAAGQTEKLVVRLKVNHPAESAIAVSVLDTALDYRDLRAERDAHEGLSLAATVVASAELVEARSDKDTLADATRAEASVNYRAAATAMESGDFGAATQAIEANAEVFKRAELKGIGGLGQEKQKNDVFYGLTTSAPQKPAAVRSLGVKELKLEALTGSGRGGASIRK